MLSCCLCGQQHPSVVITYPLSWGPFTIMGEGFITMTEIHFTPIMGEGFITTTGIISSRLHYEAA
jgi:hypothetical protein